MAAPEADLSGVLAAHGLRATRQRVAILRALREIGGHPTAAELHETVRDELPDLSLKTVYQGLDALCAAQLAACVAEGGEPQRFEARTRPHYHARCRVCGRLDDVPARLDRQIRGRTPLPGGFEPERVCVTIVGRCRRCARRAPLTRRRAHR